MSPQKLVDFIAACDLGVVSSLSAEGAPQSAVVAIAVTPDLEIVFDTVSTSRKYRNLIARPQCSVTVWRGEITVQYEGIAENSDRLRDTYFVRFPDGRDRLSWPGITYFAIRPKWIRYSDFASRPPIFEEFSF
jgi:pyridoxine/pyridoxamine 5'-phosphate oxidase